MNLYRFSGLILLFVLFGAPSVFAEHEPGKAQCPQERITLQAPTEFLKLKNPQEATEKRIKKGKLIYLVKSSPIKCKHCHGQKGDGTGDMGLEANPVARNFTCSETMREISDGQMFWAIKHGIPDTSMPAYPDLEDWKIWALIHYIRSLSG